MASTQIPELPQEAFLEEDDTARRRQPAQPPRASRKRKPLIILTLLLIVAAIAGLVSWFFGHNYQNTDDAFIDGHVIQVSPRISAEVVGMHIVDNEEVSKGQLLIELDPRDYQVALEKARAQLLEAQAQEELAKAQLAQQTAQMNIASINFNRNSSLYRQDIRAVAKEDVDTTQTSLDAARASVQAASAQVDSTQAAVVAAQAEVDTAALNLSYTRITAPEAGRITRRTVEPGNYVTAGQTLFSIVQHDVWVTANFKETQLARMKRGQKVRIHVDAFPQHDFNGHVDSFQLGTGSEFGVLPAENATGNYVKVVQRVPLKIVFDEPPDALMRLSPGMSVEPRVDVSSDGN